MPAQLPPPPVPVVAPWGDLPDASRALGPGNPLEAAYRQAARALGVHCVGASVVTVDGPLPVGLKAFLDRHNPALAQAAMASPDSTQRFVTAPHIATEAIEISDRQVLGWLVQEHLLSHMPTYSVDDVGANGGLTRTEAGFPELTRISVDANPQPIFHLEALGLQDRVDPVLFRWLVVLHEAGHAQMAHEPNVFTLAGLTPPERTLINSVMWGPAAIPDNLSRVFKESYADAFASLTLLRLTHASPAGLQAVEGLRQARVLLSARMAAQHTFDVDATSATLNRLSADLAQHPERLQALQTASPEQVRTWAARYASWGVRQWAQAWEESHPKSPVFAVGWVFPSVSGAFSADEKDLIAKAFAVLLEEKVHTYARQRIVAYLQAGSQGIPQAPQTDGDPLLELLARDDAKWHAIFDKAQSDPRHARAAMLLRAPIFPGAGAEVINEAFDQLPEVQKTTDAMRLVASLMLDTPEFTDREGQFQLARMTQARAALLRTLPSDDLWGPGPTPAITADVRPARRRRF